MTRIELIAYCAVTTILSYLFWKDPLHLIAGLLLVTNGQLIMLRIEAIEHFKAKNVKYVIKN